MNQRDLGIIFTENCNYRGTFYRHGGVAHEIFQTLNPNDYLFLYDAVREQQGINGVSLTGGEPLMDPNIESFCKLLHDHGAKITLMTSGSMLDTRHEVGKWVNKINLSLNSLNQEQYAGLLQKRGKIGQILNNLDSMRKTYPDLLIGLNVVIIRGRNDNKEDIKALIDLADKYKLSIKFVEHHSKTNPIFMSLEELKPILHELGFEKYKEDEKGIVYGRGKRIVLLAKSCGESNGGSATALPNQGDILISPDGLLLQPSSKATLSIYDAIKNHDREKLESLLELATEFEGDLAS